MSLAFQAYSLVIQESQDAFVNGGITSVELVDRIAESLVQQVGLMSHAERQHLLKMLCRDLMGKIEMLRDWE